MSGVRFIVEYPNGSKSDTYVDFGAALQEAKRTGGQVKRSVEDP